MPCIQIRRNERGLKMTFKGFLKCRFDVLQRDNPRFAKSINRFLDINAIPYTSMQV